MSRGTSTELGEGEAESEDVAALPRAALLWPMVRHVALVHNVMEVGSLTAPSTPRPHTACPISGFGRGAPTHVYPQDTGPHCPPAAFLTLPLIVAAKAIAPWTDSLRPSV